jgi:hypothetical protein
MEEVLQHILINKSELITSTKNTHLRIALPVNVLLTA